MRRLASSRSAETRRQVEVRCRRASASFSRHLRRRGVELPVPVAAVLLSAAIRRRATAEAVAKAAAAEDVQERLHALRATESTALLHGLHRLKRLLLLLLSLLLLRRGLLLLLRRRSGGLILTLGLALLRLLGTQRREQRLQLVVLLLHLVLHCLLLLLCRLRLLLLPLLKLLELLQLLELLELLELLVGIEPLLIEAQPLQPVLQTRLALPARVLEVERHPKVAERLRQRCQLRCCIACGIEGRRRAGRRAAHAEQAAVEGRTVEARLAAPRRRARRDTPDTSCSGEAVDLAGHGPRVGLVLPERHALLGDSGLDLDAVAIEHVKLAECHHTLQRRRVLEGDKAEAAPAEEGERVGGMRG